MNARRIAALLEVLGVYVVGQYLVTLFVSTLHLQIDNPLAHINAQITDAELLFASRDLFFLLLLQYAGWFLLIVPINWWHRRTRPGGLRTHASRQTLEGVARGGRRHGSAGGVA